MTTLLIGASGATGLAVLAQASEQGLSVRALVRHPELLKQATRHALDMAQGDVLNPASLETALQGIDTVICSLGTKVTFKPVTILSQGTRNLVQAMQIAGARRLLCVTGVGAGDSRGHGGFLYDRIINPLLLRTIYEDKNRQELVVRDSGLDWTIVRPATLTNGPLTSSYREITNIANQTLTTISRNDVAQFLLKEAAAGRYIQQTVNLSK